MAERGGMCRNPFGGRTRLDRLDFLGSVAAGAPQEKVLYLQTITDAVHNYLFFGLGRNGTTAEEFAYACEYLFKIRSTDTSSWPEGSKHMSFVSEGGTAASRRVVTELDLTDSQFRSMCFDMHYEYSGLNLFMNMERFLKYLVAERTQILNENWPQVNTYLNHLHVRACNEAETGHQLPLPPLDRQSIMIQPTSPADVARLMYLPKSYRTPPPTKGRHCRTKQ